MRRKRRSARGFTIIEILIAIAVISVALLGTIAAIAFGLRASKLGSENSFAIQTNRKVLELILQGIKDLPSPTTTNHPFDHGPADPKAPRGTSSWRPLVQQGVQRWFDLKDFGYEPGTREADQFMDQMRHFELDVSAVQASVTPSNTLSVTPLFKDITVQTRWLEKDTGNWKVVSTKAFSVAGGS